MSVQTVKNITLCSPRPSAVVDSPTSVKNPTSPVLVTTTIDIRTLPPNHILVCVDHFGFSANNVTYQALGEHPHFRYFDYHPAPLSPSVGVSPQTHGLIPVWGFGTIQASAHQNLSVGERVYGYFAPARYLVLPISPKDVNKFAAYVPRPCLPVDRRPYNQILRCAADPQYDKAYEELTMLYRPLFWTSFWFEDYLHSTLVGYSTGTITTETSHASNRTTASTHVNFLISSASSKTAFCLAYLIRTRTSLGQAHERTRLIGLTSTKNVGFTKGLGLYTDVHPYNVDLRPILGVDGEKWVYVDVAGNDTLNARVTPYFRSGTGRLQLAKAVSLGLTNLSPVSGEGSSKEWNTNRFSSPSSSSAEKSTSTSTTSVTSTFEQFFMPEWLSQRQRQIPIHEIFARQKKAWDALMRDCQPWLNLECARGARNVQRAYGEVVTGEVGPEKGMVWSMWDSDAEARLEAKL